LAILQINVKRDSGKRNSRHSQRREAQRPSPQDDGTEQRSTHFSNGGGKETSTAHELGNREHLSDDWQQVVWRLSPGTPIGRALVSATQRLEEAGSASAHLDAQVILAHVLGQDRGWLFAHYDVALDEEQAAHFTDLVARRAAAEPVAYLVGRKEFYGLELSVDKRVLIPRPETELLVDAVLDHIDSRADKHVTVADVGTGSGAIALAVAANAPEATIYALDVSEEALDVARRNVETYQQQERVIVLRSDLLADLPTADDHPLRFHIIAANLPYINSAAMDTLESGIRDYEPHLALAGGEDGLAVIRRLLIQIPARLEPGGVIFLEIGSDQGPATVDLVHEVLPQAAYVGLRQDYHGLDRLVVIGL
jgi:release factor glutamine methyltransferase